MRAFTAILAVAAALTACSGVLAGNGRIETERRTVPAFSSISVGGSGSLKVHKGAFKIELRSDSNILPYIITEVVGSELRIGTKPGTVMLRATRLEYDITLPSLEGIAVSGSGEADFEAFDGKALSVSLSGSGSLSGKVDYDRVKIGSSGSGQCELEGDFGDLEVKLSGSGEAVLSGSASSSRIGLSGSGYFSGRDLRSLEAKVDASGSGRIDLRAEDSLEVSLSGSGSLRYWGNPRLSSHVSGSADIKKAGD